MAGAAGAAAGAAAVVAAEGAAAGAAVWAKARPVTPREINTANSAALPPFRKQTFKPFITQPPLLMNPREKPFSVTRLPQKTFSSWVADLRQLPNPFFTTKGQFVNFYDFFTVSKIHI